MPEFDELFVDEMSEDSDDDLSFDEAEEVDSQAITLDLDGDGDPDLMFLLDPVPGAPDAEEIIVSEDEDEEGSDKDEEDVEVEDDPWDWQSKGPGFFIDWLKKRFTNVPQHSGYDTTGLEKAISYFEALDKEITRAMRQDYKDEINHAHAERAREQIEKALDGLIKRLEDVKSTKYTRHKKKSDKKKKSSLTEGAIVKEASRGEKIIGIVITVPLLISRIARVCVNGVVSAGHDINDMFLRQAKEYSLDKREKAELAQLLDDMGYPMFVDRGLEVGDDLDSTRSDNFDFAANFRG
jgi:hypothetical protein